MEYGKNATITTHFPYSATLHTGYKIEKSNGFILSKLAHPKLPHRMRFFVVNDRIKTGVLILPSVFQSTILTP
jgi:hypothetical protein